ncbi:MAG: hypothetical protein AAB368_11765, partial [bacterium]
MTFLLLLLAGAAFAKEPALTYPPLEFTVPHATRTVLSSGATAFLAEDREFPLVYLSGSIRGGVQLEPADRIGLSVYSPPFGGLYSYSSNERDLSNCTDYDQFFEHYDANREKMLKE